MSRFAVWYHLHDYAFLVRIVSVSPVYAAPVVHACELCLGPLI